MILMKIFITYFCFYYFYFKNLVPIFLSILFIWPRPSVRIMGSPGEHNFITSFAAGAAVWPSLQFTASTSLISPPFGPRIQFSDFGFIDRMPRVAVAKIGPETQDRTGASSHRSARHHQHMQPSMSDQPHSSPTKQATTQLSPTWDLVENIMGLGMGMGLRMGMGFGMERRDCPLRLAFFELSSPLTSNGDKW